MKILADYTMCLRIGVSQPAKYAVFADRIAHKGERYDFGSPSCGIILL